MNDETENMVEAYLREHADFFANHLDLLDTLKIPHAQKGQLSLVEMQLERQREQIKALELMLDKFGRLAHQEQDIFLALIPLQQKLAHAEHFLEGVEVLNQWAKSYELQQAKILLFNDHWQKNSDVPEQFWLDRKGFELIRLERLGLRKFYLGELTNKEKSLIFTPDELPVGSIACCLLGVRSNQHQPTAILLFSARDTRRFYNGQDTAFLRHLVDIVELHLHRWLLNFEQ
ncbi:DUF484 family protein [Pasteurellaceae bacterium LIM206]|nr:DUF484 family protein [Pasteurellaceae bacterium LIM206]